jgi:hypothetical protein
VSNIFTHIEEQTVRTKTTTIRLGREEVINILRREGVTVPTSVEIYFPVPGGADWSNTNIDIDSNTPIVVRWTERECS